MTQLSKPALTAAAQRSMVRMARSSTANLVGAVATALCTFALTVAVTRGFSRADAGVFFSMSSLFLVATSIGQLGCQTALVYFLSRARALGRTGTIDSYLRYALRPVVAVAVAMALAMIVWARPLAELTCPLHVSEATTYLRILALFVPAAGAEVAWLAATRGLGSMRSTTLIEQIFRPAAQLLLALGASVVASSTLLAWGWSVAYVPAAWASWLAWRALRAKVNTGDAAATFATFVEFWRFALPRALTSVIQIVMQRFDIVLVGALAGVVDAAVYAAATRFIVVGQLGTNALTLSVQPQLAKHLARADHHAANELYQVSTAWLILVTWPVYLTLIAFAGPLLRVFGRGYDAGGDVVLILALSMLLATGLGMVDTLLSMAGRTSWNLANAALALTVNLGLDFWLIPTHGIVGAAIGWAVAIAVRNVAAFTQIALALRYHPVAESSVTAIALTLGCYLLLLGVIRLELGGTVTALLLGLSLATSCYGGGLWLLRRPLRLQALVGLRRRGRTRRIAADKQPANKRNS